jgi:hypothetical protein
VTFLPIVERELRVAARRRGTYWLRFAAGLLALGLGGIAYAAYFGRLQSEIGRQIFTNLAVLAAGVCLLSGAVLTAGCLNAEKREGTLGLLFLTDLKGYDIVVGKLAATATSGIYAVLAVFPVLAIPLLLGGVGVVEFGCLALALGNTLFFSLAAGLLASALCWDDRKALGLTLLLILGQGLLQPIIGMAICDWNPADMQNAVFPPDKPAVAIGLLLFWSSPTAALITAHQTNGWYWFSLLIVHLLSWTFLIVAAWHIPRSWQEKRIAATGRLRAGQAFWHGSPAWRKTFRQRQLAINPFLWLAGRERWKPILVWGFLGACAVLWGLAAWYWHQIWFNEITYVISGLLLGAVIKVWIAVEAGQQFAADRRSNALELLLVTPLTVREMVRGQWLALRRQFIWPLRGLLGVDLLFMGAVIASGNVDIMLTLMAGIAVLLLDVFALGWLGMWLGLSSRRWSPGFLASAYVLGLPWGLVVGFAIGMSFLHDIIRNLNGPCIGHYDSPEVAAPIWFIFSILLDLAICWWAKSRLLRRFRLVATRPLGSQGFSNDKTPRTKE